MKINSFLLSSFILAAASTPAFAQAPEEQVIEATAFELPAVVPQAAAENRSDKKEKGPPRFTATFVMQPNYFGGGTRLALDNQKYVHTFEAERSIIAVNFRYTNDFQLAVKGPLIVNAGHELRNIRISDARWTSDGLYDDREHIFYGGPGLRFANKYAGLTASGVAQYSTLNKANPLFDPDPVPGVTMGRSPVAARFNAFVKPWRFLHLWAQADTNGGSADRLELRKANASVGFKNVRFSAGWDFRYGKGIGIRFNFE